jgi:putative aminopeptidase FrvX
MINNKFLEQYLNTYSPTGEESAAQKVFYNYLKEYGYDMAEYHSYYNNLYMVKDGEIDYNKPTVVLEAHVDEIAWQISHIEKNGICRVQRNGGSDSVIAPSQRVVAHTKKGIVNGVFGYPAIHVRKDDKVSKPQDLILDFGVVSDIEVREKGIEIGDMVTFDTQYSKIGKYHSCKSLDNKIGGFIIAEVARRLVENKVDLPFNLVIANCVAEETGLHGGSFCAKTVKPDVAFVIDVCHHTDTDTMDKRIEGEVLSGKGGVIERKFHIHRGILKHLEETASRYNIPYQNNIGSTGNDTFSFYREEIPTAIVAIPLKYMHTTVEMVHEKDIETIIEFYYYSILKLNINEILAYSKNKITE